ncbi:MAG: alpha/beta fold hydrolase [Christensenellaceae bacterium]|nr:alpha/beta fold hydrolase [Christensenellaceae bacterium]
MEILRIKVMLDGMNELKAQPCSIRMLPFHGSCESKLFCGTILPGGVDTQVDFAPGQNTLSARYMLEGTDAEGKPCRLYIDNSAVSRKGSDMITHPRVTTDSAALKWLESAALTGKIESKDDHLEIVIDSEDRPNVTRIELKRAGLTLQGLLTRPGDGPCPLVLMLHGFGGCMDAKGGFFQDVSDRLLAAGFATLRLDFNGHGQSDGNFTEMTPYNEIEDAATFLRYAMGLDFVTDIHVLGHSQGGVVAGMLAGYYHDIVSRLVLLAPAASLKTDAQQGHCMWADYDPQHIPYSVDVDGRHHVGGLFFRMAQSLPIYEVTGQFAGPMLVVFGKRDQLVSREAARRYTDGAEQREFALYDTLDHGLQGEEYPTMLDRVAAFLQGT